MIETQLRQWIENRVDFLPWYQPGDQLIHQLVDVIQAHLVRSEDGTLLAPSEYIIYLNPNSTTAWQAQSDGLASLAQSLQENARQAGIQFNAPPVLRIALDDSLPHDGLRVETAPAPDSLGHTSAMPLQLTAPAEVQVPPGACLTTPEDMTYPLNLPVINIGRRNDNHLILDDPRISRTHAQIRLVRGQYLIVDLNSTSGTFVNGERITRAILRPGDVISLSGNILIYHEDSSREP